MAEGLEVVARQGSSDSVSAGPAIRAAGGLVIDGTGAGLRIALVHRPAYDDWTLPKGKCEEGESWEECALREVEEETALRCRLLGRLGTTTYTDDRGRPKEVHWWLMRHDGGELRGQSEVDEARWMAPSAALELLTYERDRELLAPLLRETRLWVVRHADAGDRAAWTKPDNLRPLNKRGRQQARLLGDMLAGLHVERLASSPYVRCMQTLEPAGARLNLPVEEIAELAEGYGLEGIEPLLLSGGAAAACTHGDVIDDLIHELRAAGLAPPNAKASKGSVWALRARAGQILAAEYTAPLA